MKTIQGDIMCHNKEDLEYICTNIILKKYDESEKMISDFFCIKIVKVLLASQLTNLVDISRCGGTYLFWVFW